MSATVSLPRRAAWAKLPPIAGRKEYLRACESAKVAPKALDYITGHSAKLCAAEVGLQDHDLLAIAEMLPAQAIEEADLGGSKLLTGRSLVPFLQRLVEGPTLKALRLLSLRDCVRASLAAQQATVEVLQAVEGLRRLDLGHVPIALKYQLPLCEAIRDHPYLESATITDIGLGGNSLTLQCVGALGACKVKTLDLGWNSLGPEDFVCLADRLGENPFLHSLGLSNCSAHVDAVDTPISYFLERVSLARQLTRLDVSLNGIDFQSALVMEDALSQHKSLTHINLSGNPMGVLGMRSAMRLLCNPHSGLLHFEVDGSYVGVYPSAGSVQVFNATNPGGRYSLDLSRPYERAFLRMLYKTSERVGLPPDQAFKDVQSVGPGFSHASKDKNGVWQVPSEGTVTLTFNVERAIEAAVRDVEDDDFPGFLRSHFKLMRLEPSFRKLIPLCARWKELDGRVTEQETYLKALARDFSVDLAQVAHMCESSRANMGEILCTLFPVIPGDVATHYQAQMLFPTIDDFVVTRRRMKKFLNFNVVNPTGRYKLNLSSPADYAVAERLLLLDRWEALVDKRQQRFDTSSRGNHSHLRNEHYQGRSLRHAYHSIAEWSMPEEDVLEFDYTSNTRPPPDVDVLGDDTFSNFMIELFDSACAFESKIDVLRTVSSHIFVTSMHMRQLLGNFRTPEQRAEALVIFCLRIVDMYNAKACLVRFEKREEVTHLQERLGYAAFFPFIQPENYRFHLDLSMHDQRVCCSILVALTNREKDGNIRDPHYFLPDGSEQHLERGVPRSWETFEKVPTGGVFTGTYVCAPEDRHFELRKKLAVTYGYYRGEIDEKEVLWWTGLTEAPADVVIYMGWLIAHMPDLDKAFKMIDGPDGNGFISLVEFREGIETMGCTRFDGEDKPERIEAIFRYLDPGKEGTVSPTEWQVLGQLWNEFEYSICEFVQFLVRTFGEDLADAWDALDTDGSGELSLDEWTLAVENMGYFGPSQVVFMLLDKSNDGQISLDEFQVLQKYKALPRRSSQSSPE